MYAKGYVLARTEDFINAREIIRNQGILIQEVNLLRTQVKNVIDSYGGTHIDERVGRLEWMIRNNKTRKEADEHFLQEGKW